MVEGRLEEHQGAEDEAGQPERSEYAVRRRLDVGHEEHEGQADQPQAGPVH